MEALVLEPVVSQNQKSAIKALILENIVRKTIKWDIKNIVNLCSLIKQKIID